MYYITIDISNKIFYPFSAFFPIFTTLQNRFEITLWAIRMTIEIFMFIYVSFKQFDFLFLKLFFQFFMKASPFVFLLNRSLCR